MVSRLWKDDLEDVVRWSIDCGVVVWRLRRRALEVMKMWYG